MSRIVTIEEAAAELRVTPRLLRSQIRAGKVPVIDLGRQSKRIDLDALAPKLIEQPSQRQVTAALRRRRNDLPPVPDHLAD